MISEGVIVAVVTTIIAPSIAWLLKRSNKNLEKIDKNLTEISERLKKTEGGTLGVLKYRLIQDMSKFLKEGSITIAQLEDLKDLYQHYTALDGNSTVTELFSRCQKLPLKKEDN